MIPKIFPRPQIEDDRAVRVKNIVGKPLVVEAQVNEYLRQGYDLGGPMLPYKDPDTGQSLFVQQVILYEQEDTNSESITPRCQN